MSRRQTRGTRRTKRTRSEAFQSGARRASSSLRWQPCSRRVASFGWNAASAHATAAYRPARSRPSSSSSPLQLARILAERRSNESATSQSGRVSREPGALHAFPIAVTYTAAYPVLVIAGARVSKRIRSPSMLSAPLIKSITAVSTSSKVRCHAGSRPL